MRVAIDVQAAFSHASKNRGVGRYIKEMVQSLIEEAKNLEIILVANSYFIENKKEIVKCFNNVFGENDVKIFYIPDMDFSGIKGKKEVREFLEILWEWYLSRLDVDILWIPNMQEGWHDNAVVGMRKEFPFRNVCTTLHDVIPLIYKDDYLKTSIKDWYFDKINQTKKSDFLLTVSNFSKKKIIEELKFDKNEIYVAENAVNPNIFYEKNSQIINEKFILYSGGLDKHKNLDLLISAYSLLPLEIKNTYYLCFVGGAFSGNENSLREKFYSYGLDINNFKILGYVDDDEMRHLYTSCSVFVFPSYSEGFGLPLLEAMACGAPVLCANAASLPEIIDFQDALFDPYNSKDLSEKLEKILSNSKFRDEVKQHAIIRSKNFSWNKSSKLINELFLEKSNKKSNEFLIPDLSDLIRVLKKNINFNEINDAELRKLATAIARNSLDSKKNNRLHIDLSTLVHFDHATGIQRVTRALASELLKRNIKKYDVSFLMSYAGHEDFYKVDCINGKFIKPSLSELKNNVIDFFDGDVILIVDLHPSSLISKKKKIAELQKQGVKIIVVVYDLLPLEYKNFFADGLPEEFQEWLGVVALADQALCISKDVAEKFKNYIEKNNITSNGYLKISHFPLGADIENSMPSNGLDDVFYKNFNKINNITTFLMIGTIEPRKGHLQVLQAFDNLWHSGLNINLVIVGKQGWKVDDLVLKLETHGERSKKLFWFNGVSDQALQKIYEISDCLIAASYGEGFGLPLIEAAQNKIPIFARDLDVFREVAGDHATYFSANDSHELAKELKKWLILYEKNLHPKSDLMPWLTWEQSAQRLLKEIELN